MSRRGQREKLLLGGLRRSPAFTRLSYLVRRYGTPAAAILTLAALGVWLGPGGAGARGWNTARQEVWDLSARNGFAVKDILVTGREHTAPDLLRRVLGIGRGDPLLAFDPAEARLRLESISWIREARVERRFPDTISISLIERQPAALWQHSGKVNVIDAEGVTLDAEDLSPFQSLPLITGRDAPQLVSPLLRLIDRSPAVKARLEAAAWVGDRRWDLHLHSGLVIHLPENGVEEALARLSKESARDKLLDRPTIGVIDLREKNRLVLRPRPEVAEGIRKHLQSGNSSVTGKPVAEERDG